KTEDRLDLVRAEEILDERHHGLEKVKERVLEFLAVLKLKGDLKGPILCFAGPPGVGKTSLGAAIAGALGRKFVRMAVGGVTDESEIRGHRKTRSEEHTSELQSLRHLVCRLLLEKKNTRHSK